MLLNKTIFNFIYFTIQYIAYTPFVILLNRTYIPINKCVFFSVFTALISSIFCLVLPTSNIAIAGIFYIILVFICSMFIFNIDRTSNFLFTTICSLIIFFTNIICASFKILTSYKGYLGLHLLIILFNVFAFYKLLCNFDTKKLIHNLKSLPDIYFLILILLLTYNSATLANLELVYISLFIQLSLALFMLYIIVSNYNINKIKLIISNTNYEYNKLKSIIDDIRMFKHDYNNTLCSIGGYISLNDMTGLKKFYYKLTSDFNKTNNTQMINPIVVNEPSLYNLLMSKYNNIVQKNLKFNFYSSINYKKLRISPYDLSKILGIFLDNAIDAACKSNEKEISLTCEINKNKNYQITIKNSYMNKDVDTEKIFLKGYSSKDVKSGLGLWEVAKIIKHIPNISLHTEKDENYFIQKLIIST